MSSNKKNMNNLKIEITYGKKFIASWQEQHIKHIYSVGVAYPPHYFTRKAIYGIAWELLKWELMMLANVLATCVPVESICVPVTIQLITFTCGNEVHIPS